MQWDNTIKATDVAIVIATLMGPIFAVQAQAFLERRRGLRTRRTQIFYTLMRTRASGFVPDHVNAINAIPIEFHKVKSVIDAHKKLIAHLNAQQTNLQAWLDRRLDLLAELLYKIAVELGYKFEFAELKSEYYAPQWQSALDIENATIRQGFAKIMRGEAGLKVEPYAPAPPGQNPGQ